MKETIKVAVLFVFVMIVGFLVTSTKGDDELKWNVDMDLSWPTEGSEFSYAIVDSEYNGVYKNGKNNGVYIMIGKNADDTYRIYMKEQIAGIPKLEVQLDQATMKEGRVDFTNSYDTPLYLEFQENGSFIIDARLGSMGDSSLEGAYTRTRTISEFSNTEFDA